MRAGNPKMSAGGPSPFSGQILPVWIALDLESDESRVGVPAAKPPTTFPDIT